VVKWKEWPLRKGGSKTGRAAQKMARADLGLAVAESGKRLWEAEEMLI